MKKLLIAIVLTLLPVAAYSQTAQPVQPAQPPQPAATPPGPEPTANAAGHEFSPLTEKTVNYKNWTLPHLTSDDPQDLRSLMAERSS